jgi:capsular polysaccharide biosynthesis protein
MLAACGADARVRWHQAREAAPIAEPHIERIGDAAIDWPALGSQQYPPCGIVELRGGHHITGQGWAISDQGVAVADTTWYGSAYSEIKAGVAHSRVRRIRGTALSLLSDFAQINYYHFRVDALSRYALYETLAAAVPKPDVVLCPRPLSKRLERWIDLLKLGDVQVALLGRDDRVRADCLLVPSFPGLRRQTAAWTVDFWRGRCFSVEPPSGHRKLYLPRRSTTRAITNEPELEAALTARGFEIIDPADLTKPEEVFAQASIVIGAHGAALTDAMFCPRDALLLEIVPSDHVFPYYYCLAGATGLGYAYIVARSAGQRNAGSLGPSPYDMTVDVNALLDWLDARDVARASLMQ